MPDLTYTDEQRQQFRKLGIPVPGESAPKLPQQQAAAVRQGAWSDILRSGRRQAAAEDAQK